MEIDKKRHGYLYLPRQTKLLLKELGYDLFGFYIGLVMEANWYRGNKKFGCITQTQAELAKELYMTQETISRKLKKLEQHRYCIIRRKDGILLGFFPLFLKDVSSKLHSKNYTDLYQLYAEMHKINADLQEEYTKMQQERTKKPSQRTYGSSKDSYSSYQESEEVDADDIAEGFEKWQREKGGGS